MEEDKTYTYEMPEKKEGKSVKVIFGIIVAALFVLAVLLGVLLAVLSSPKEEETTVPTTVESTTVEESTTSLSQHYQPGTYIVKTGGSTLRFRKDHTADAEVIMDITDGTEVTVEEVFFDETASDTNYQYWGKISYLGYSGWLVMSYLEKTYSDNVVVPSDTTSEAVTASGETTSAGGAIAAEGVTDSTGYTVSTKYASGDYTVSTGGSTLRFKQAPGRNANVIMDIADTTKVTVLGVYEITETDDAYRYWGKISYLGYTGYVSMAYLTKAG